MSVTEVAYGQGWAAPAVRFGRTRYLLALAAVALAYNGAAQVSYVLEFAGPVAAVVWLPVGVGIAFVYFGGLWLLPGVVIGDLFANQYSTLPVWSAIGQSVGNVLEVAVATLLIWRFVRRGSPLDSVAGVCFLLAAICVGVAVSATVGTLSLLLGGVLTASDLPTVWSTWWLGDACGALLVVPLAMAWWPSARTISCTAPRVLEASAMIAAVAALTVIPSRSHRPLVYVVFPSLIWAALRFGSRGATLAICVSAGVTIITTTHNDGAFAYDSITHSVHAIQLFVAVSAVSTLLLAAAMAERGRYARELARSRARILDATRQERKRLERDLHDGAQQRLTWLAVRLRDAAGRGSQRSGAEALRHAEAEVETAIQELRDLARGLHPAVLTDLGLGAAVRSAALRTTIPVVSVDVGEDRVDERIETAAYFVIAEAATNAQKHAGAQSIAITGAVEGGALRIGVADDGRGGADVEGSGIQGMRDRIESLGGVLSVESPVGVGTRISATIPLAKPPNRDR
jgi:signal transduction histidine kinase